MAVSQLGEVSFHLNSFHSQFPIPPLLLKSCQDVWHFPVRIWGGFILAGTAALGAAALAALPLLSRLRAVILLGQDSKYKQLEGEMLSSLSAR